MFTSILAILVMSFILTPAYHAQSYQPTFQVQIPGKILEIQYSHDQRYIALATSNAVYLFNGVTNQLLNVIYIPVQIYNYTTLAFSRDSSNITIGLIGVDGKNGFKTYSAKKGYWLQYIQTFFIKTALSNGKITSMCYTSDNNRLIYGTSNGDVVAYNFIKNIQQFVKFTNDVPVTSVACSPNRNLEFAVAGNNQQQIQAQLILYEIGHQTLENALIIKHAYTVNTQQGIRSITYSFNGDYIYSCSRKGLYRSSTNNTYEQQILYFPLVLLNFRKIRVSKQQDVYAVSTDNQILYLNKKLPYKNENQEQTHFIGNPSFGLAPSGVNLFLVKDDTNAQVLSQCKINQYFDEKTLLCSDCDQYCSLCLTSSKDCYSCPQSYYLQNTYCFSCLIGCQSCNNGKTCSICYKQFQLTNGLCFCKKGTFLNELKCVSCAENCLDCRDRVSCYQCASNYQLVQGLCIQRNSFPVWAIVLLVLLGIVIIIVVIVCIYRKNRKYKKRSLLQNYSHEQIEKVPKI